MKKKHLQKFAMFICFSLCFSAGALFASCSEAELALAGTEWTVEDIVYRFNDDGTVEANGFQGSYEWDGTGGQISADGMTVQLLLANGSLYMEGEDGSLYPLEPVGETASAEEERAYAGESGDAAYDEEEQEYTEETEEFTLPGTVWCLDEYEYIGFYPDGSLSLYDGSGGYGGSGAYTWDGSTGWLELNDMAFDFVLEEDRMVMTDGEDSFDLVQADSLPALLPSETMGAPLAGTTWFGGANALTFFTDGRMSRYSRYAADNEIWGEYEWDETAGVGYLYLDDTRLEVLLTPEDTLMVEIYEDEEVYFTYDRDPENTYLGEAYTEIPGEETGFYPGGEEHLLEGFWEHCDDSSVYFYFDGIGGAALYEEEYVTEAAYTYDGETLYLYDPEYPEDALYGFLDSDGDLQLEDVDGWFVYTDE